MYASKRIHLYTGSLCKINGINNFQISKRNMCLRFYSLFCFSKYSFFQRENSNSTASYFQLSHTRYINIKILCFCLFCQQCLAVQFPAIPVNANIYIEKSDVSLITIDSVLSITIFPEKRVY